MGYNRVMRNSITTYEYRGEPPIGFNSWAEYVAWAIWTKTIAGLKIYPENGKWIAERNDKYQIARDLIPGRNPDSDKG